MQHTKLIGVTAAFLMLAIAPGATAYQLQTDEAEVPVVPICELTTVNGLQCWISLTHDAAQRSIDNAQDDAEYVLEMVCDVACNFVSATSLSTGGILDEAVDLYLRCSITSVNGVQCWVAYGHDYAQYLIDYGQDRIEDVLDLVCNIACNYVEMNSVESSAAVQIPPPVLPCNGVTVNAAQCWVAYGHDYGQYLIDWTQYRVEDALDEVCDIACNYVEMNSVESSAAMSHPPAIYLRCPITSVNGVQCWVSYGHDVAQAYIDYTQYLIEYGLDEVCDVACNFADVAEMSAASAYDVRCLICCDPGTVNNLQCFISYGHDRAQRAIDNAQDDVEDTLDEVCNIVCNYVEATSLSSSAYLEVRDVQCCPLPCPGGITVNNVQCWVSYGEGRAQKAVDDAQDDVEDAIDDVCNIVCNENVDVVRVTA